MVNTSVKGKISNFITNKPTSFKFNPNNVHLKGKTNPKPGKGVINLSNDYWFYKGKVHKCHPGGTNCDSRVSPPPPIPLNRQDGQDGLIQKLNNYLKNQPKSGGKFVGVTSHTQPVSGSGSGSDTDILQPAVVAVVLVAHVLPEAEAALVGHGRRAAAAVLVGLVVDRLVEEAGPVDQVVAQIQAIQAVLIVVSWPATQAICPRPRRWRWICNFL